MSEDQIGAIIFLVWMALWIAIARWRKAPIGEWIRDGLSRNVYKGS